MYSPWNKIYKSLPYQLVITDGVYEKVIDFCIDSLWNQSEDVITDISFHEYYYYNADSGYDFYITCDVDMDKIVKQVKEEIKKDEIDLGDER